MKTNAFSPFSCGFITRCNLNLLIVLKYRPLRSHVAHIACYKLLQLNYTVTIGQRAN